MQTPRTDKFYSAALRDFNNGIARDQSRRSIRFARMLERENSKLREALQKFYEVNTRYGIGGLGMEEYLETNHLARETLKSTEPI